MSCCCRVGRTMKICCCRVGRTRKSCCCRVGRTLKICCCRVGRTMKSCCCRVGRTMKKVNCKGTWEGTYRFSYEVERGGGGICDSPGSSVVACQEPGSVYVDNEVFRMYFGKCPMVSTSMNNGL